MSLWDARTTLYKLELSIMDTLFPCKQTANCTTTAFYQRPYENSGKEIKHCSVVQCRVATQHMTGYISLYWPLSIDKLRIQLPETSSKNCFHWHKWGTPLIPLGSLAWTILRGNATDKIWSRYLHIQKRSPHQNQKGSFSPSIMIDQNSIKRNIV